MMKRIIYSLIFSGLMLFSSISWGQQKGDSFEAAKKSQTANLVYVHANVNGFAKTNGSGASGLLVDLMNDFEEYVNNKYGITFNVKYVAAKDNDFKMFLEEVKNANGGVFGLSNTSIKEERKKFLQFSPSYLNNISVLVSNSSFPTLSSLDNISKEFDGKTGYGVESTTNYARMMEVKRSKFSAMKITSVNSSKEIISNSIQDKDGFGFVDIHYYLEALNAGKAIKRHAVGDKTGDKFGIIMPLDSDWAPILKEYLDSGVLESPDYRQAVISHLGKGALRMLQ